MKIFSSHQLKTFFLFVWTVVILWIFVHRFPLFHLGEVLQNGFLLVFLFLFFVALGRRLFRIFHLAFPSFSEEISYAFAAGTGLIIFLMILLASLNGLYPFVIVLLVMTLAGCVYPEMKALCLQGYEAFLRVTEKKHSLFNQFCIVMIVVISALTFFAAATPPFFFDALNYHLGIPHKYLQQNGFHYIPHHFYSNFPANIGMLFAVGLSFSGGILAHLLSWMFAPMTAFAVYACAKSRWGNSVALTSALIIFFVPGVLIASILTSVDNAVMFYSFLSLSALLSWCTKRHKSWFIMSGIFCGLAVGSKYTAIPVTFIALELILFIHEYVIEKHSLLAVLRKIALFGLLVLLLASPWFVKNAMYTGNPLFPFLNSIFDVQKSASVVYQQMVSQNILSKSLLEILFYYLASPWTTTMAKTKAAGLSGILFLFGTPFIVFGFKRMDRLLRYLLLGAVCSFTLWACFLPRILRYAFPLLPSASILLAYSLWHFPLSQVGKKILLVALSFITLYHIGMFFTEASIFRPLTYLFPHNSKEEFLLEHGVNYYPALDYINNKSPANSKFLFVGEMRGFYCQRDYELQAVRSDEDIFLQQQILQHETIEELLHELHKQHFSHLLVNISEMQRIAQNFLHRETFFHFNDHKKQKLLEAFFSERYLRPLFSKYQVVVYEILYPEAAD